MSKLTEAQRRILERMAAGDEVWTVYGRRPRAFWSRAMNDRAPGFPTLHALAKAGLIENVDRMLGGAKYRITPAGRRALEGETP